MTPKQRARVVAIAIQAVLPPCVILLLPFALLRLASSVDPLRATYNYHVLWGVNYFHAHEWTVLGWIALTILVLAAAAPVASHQKSQAARFGILVVSTGLLLATSTFVAMYVFHPWSLHKFSPLVCSTLAAAVFYVMLRSLWIWAPFFRLAFTRSLHARLNHDPRVEDHFALLAALRPNPAAEPFQTTPDPGGARLALNDRPGRFTPPELRAPSNVDNAAFFQGAEAGVAEDARSVGPFRHVSRPSNIVMTCSLWIAKDVAKIPVVGAPLLRFCMPKTRTCYLEQDPLLYQELCNATERHREAYESALYGYEGTAPELTVESMGRAAHHFFRWLAGVDAIGECVALDADRLAEKPPESSERLCLLEAADRYADAWRACHRRTFHRLEQQDGKIDFNCFLLLDGQDGGQAPLARKVATKLLFRELRCVELFAEGTASKDTFQTIANLTGTDVNTMTMAIETRRGLEALLHIRLLVLRLVAAEYLHDDEAGRHSLGRNINWPTLQASMDAALVEALRDANIPERIREFAMQTRLRAQECFLFYSQITPIKTTRASFARLPNRELLEKWERLDQMVEGDAQFAVAAGGLSAQLQDANIQLGVDAYEKWGHCSIRALPLYLAVPFARRNPNIAATLARVSAANAPPKEAEILGLSGEEIDAPVRDQWPYHRRAPFYAQPTLLACCAVVWGLFLIVGLIRGRNALVDVPDFRLGEVRLSQEVRSLSAGNEPHEPSLWVGTDRGVHVKAGGRNHHWYHFSTEDSGLLTDSVVRITVGEEDVAYLCSKVGSSQRGLCLSSAPARVPGQTPRLHINDWRHVFGFSTFGAVEGNQVTHLHQPDGAPVLAVAAKGYGLGFYKPDERRWLEALEVDAATGLPGHQGTVNHLEVGRAGPLWIVSASTDSGLAAGPIVREENGRSTPLQEKQWAVFASGDLPLSGKVLQSRVLPSGVGDYQILYQNEGEGLASFAVGAGATLPLTSRVRIGDDTASDLEQSGVRFVAYSSRGKRLWFSDTPDSPRDRVSVYREETHQFAYAALPHAGGSRVLDMTATDFANAQAYIGTDDGALRASDSEGKLQLEDLGLRNEAVIRVVPSPEGVGVVTQPQREETPFPSVRSCSAPSPAGDESPKWRTMIGSKRLPGIEREIFRCAEQHSGTTPGLWLGTAECGAVFVNLATRQVSAPFANRASDGRETARQRVVDLCSFTDEGTPYLLQVSEDNVLDIASLIGSDVDALLNTTSGHTPLDEIVSIRALDDTLYVGTSSAITSYSMDALRWNNDEASLSGLKEFHVSGGQLWAQAADLQAAEGVGLFYYASETQEWQNEFPGARCVEEEADGRLLVIDAEGHLYDVEGEYVKSEDLVAAPGRVAAGQSEPKLASLHNGRLYVAPVGGGVGGYAYATQQWTHTLLPSEADTPLRMLHANDVGLWVLDANGDLYSNDQTAAQWEQPELWRDIKRCVFSDDAVLGLRNDGQVVYRKNRNDIVLIGNASQVDPSSLSTVVQFDSKLWVAAGDSVAEYDMQKHTWSATKPSGGNDVKQLVVSGDNLYALTADGFLYRHTAQDGVTWEDQSDRLAFPKLPDAFVFDAATKPPRADSITALSDGIGVVVANVGVVGLPNAVPNTPTWLRTQSQGPPSDAVVICAAEIDGELYLGCEKEGVWRYGPVHVLDGRLPPMWRRLPLADTDDFDGTALAIVPMEGDPSRLAVLTDSEVVGLKRMGNGEWDVLKRINFDAPVTLTSAKDHFYVAFESPDGSLSLQVLSSDMEQMWLVGPGISKKDAPTNAVQIDPLGGTLFRVDENGDVFEYLRRAGAWREVTPAGVSIQRLFVAAGKLWAWSPDGNKLFAREANQWTLFAGNLSDSALHHVSQSGDALMLFYDTGAIQYLDQAGTRTILTEGARAYPAAWDETIELAELGGFLIVSTQNGATCIYDQKAHAWSSLDTSEPLSHFTPDYDDGERTPKGYYALAASGGVGYISPSPADGKLELHAVTFPRTESARTIAQAVGNVFILCESGAVYPLEGGAAQDPLLSPQPLRIDQVPTLTAALEWQGRLLLAGVTPGGSMIAMYAPDAMRWTSLSLSGTRVRKFHQIDTGKEATVFVEWMEVSGKRVGLYKLTSDGEGTLSLSKAIGPVLHAASGDGKLWVVDQDQRIKNVDLATLNLKDTPVGIGDALPEKVKSAYALGDHLHVILEDDSLWTYSITQLRWSPMLAGRHFQAMLILQREPFALEKETGKLYRFGSDENGAFIWAQVDAANSGFGMVITPAIGETDDHPAKNDCWKVGQTGGVLSLAWRLPSDEENAFTSVEVHQGRVDLNRYNRIAFRDGVLWAETKANRDGESVVRRFDADAALADADTAYDRYALDPTEAKQVLAGTSPFEFTPSLFNVQLDPESDGSWTALDAADGSRHPCAIGVRALDGSGDKEGFVSVRPVLTDGKMVLDVDVWSTFMPQTDRFVAATPAGLTARSRKKSKGVLEAFHDVLDGVSTIHERAGRLLAKTPSEVLVSSDGLAWSATDATEDRQFLDDHACVMRSNENLQSFDIARTADGDFKLMLKTLTATAVPVTLGKGGFGFDHVQAFAANDQKIQLHTPDGLVEYTPDAVGNGLDPWGTPDTSWRSPSDHAFYDVLKDPRDGTTVLLSSDRNGAYTLGADGWTELEDDTRDDLLAELDKVLLDAAGWRWLGDESVEYSLDAFAHKPLRGAYDPAKGRFTFDDMAAIHGDGKSLWVATSAGVLKFENGACVEQHQFDVIKPEEETSLHFARSAEGGSPLLQIVDADNNQTLFQWSGAQWQSLNDSSAWNAAIEKLLAGKRWSTSKTNANPGTDRSRLFQFTPDNAEGASISLDNRLLAFDDGLSVAGGVAAPVLGCKAGLLRRTASAHVAEAWTFLPTDSPVTRAENEDGSVHVQLKNGAEHIVAGQAALLLGDPPTAMFEERDRTLLSSTDWRFRRSEDGSLEMERRFGVVWRTAVFINDRFDFDRLDDLALADGEPIFATDFGFIHCELNGDYVPETDLPQTKPGDAPKFFTVWNDGTDSLFVEYPPDELHAWNATGWNAWTDDAAEILDTRDKTATQDDVWKVTHSDSGSVSFTLQLPDEEPQVVTFDPALGRFRHDDLSAVVGDSRSGKESFLVGTQGGLNMYGSARKLLRLDADLDDDGTPDPVDALWRTEDGVLARSGTNYFLRTGDAWERTNAATAKALIDKAEQQPMGGSAAWDVRRRTAPEAEDVASSDSVPFDLAWRAAPVALIRDGLECRFAHDVVTSVEAADGQLWVGTLGGLRRFLLDANDAFPLRLPAGTHLIASTNLPGFSFDVTRTNAIYHLRATQSAEGEDRLIVRVKTEGDEVYYSVDPSSSLRPIPLESLSETNKIVADHLEAGTWSLEAPGTLVAQFDSSHFQRDTNRFQFSTNVPAMQSPFRNGTLAHWAIETPAVLSPNAADCYDPLAWADGWVIATGAGFLHLNAQGEFTRYAERGASGTPLGDTFHVRVAASGELMGRSSDAIHRYRPADSTWETVSDGVCPTRFDPLDAAWLHIERTGSRGISLTLREEFTDEPAMEPLLRGGRFAFDIARDFAWDEASRTILLATPAGLVRLYDDGTPFVHRLAFGSNELQYIHAVDGNFAAGSDYRVWRYNKTWEEVDSDEARDIHFAAQLQATNPLFHCRRNDNGKLVFQIKHGDTPPLAAGACELPLLSQGVFAFDDIRDIKIEGHDLWASTRLGVWLYGLNRENVRLPRDASIFATNADGSKTPLQDLTLFLRMQKADRKVVFGCDDTAYELMDDGEWCVVHVDPPRLDNRRFAANGQEYAIQMEDDRLIVSNGSGGASEQWRRSNADLTGHADLLDAFMTDSSIWIPCDGEIVWFRRDRL